MTHPLLTPRYMVDAPNKQKGELPYPNSPFRVGDILHKERDIFAFYVYVRKEDIPVGESIDILDVYIYLSKNKKYISVGEIEDYPHIFRKMHWSEGRSLEEMPRWVRFDGYGKFRVACGTWSVVGDFMWFDDSNGNSFKLLDWVNITTPATEAEYLEYLKTKEK